jgi:capsule polysaccharide export protein KpsE/RkpR
MKQSGHVEPSAQQLQELEVATPRNGTGESLIEGTQPEDFEWAWLLWGKRRLLWRFTWRGLIVATLIAFIIPKEYESTARLMPPDSSSSSGSGMAMMAAMAGSSAGSSAMGSSALGGIASNLLGMHDPGAVWSDILRSRTVQDRVIDRFDLRKVYGVHYWAGARDRLTRNTDVIVDHKSGVITIAVTDQDKLRAQQITQAYIEELDRTVALVSTSAARRERIFLGERLQQVKHDLDEASSQFAQYASKNTVIDVDSQTKAMVEGAATLQGQLIAAQSELDGLQQIYTDNNVRVRALRARVDELRSQLQKMGGTNASLESVTPDSSQPQSDQLYPSIRKLPLLGVHWLALFRETKIQETVYELLTAEHEMAKVDEAKEIPTVKVLDPPILPEKKAGPRRMLIMLLGMLLSLSGGIVWVLGKATWQRMDQENPRRQLAQEVAATCNAVWFRLAGRFPLIAKIGAWGSDGKPSSEGLK